MSARIWERERWSVPREDTPLRTRTPAGEGALRRRRVGGLRRVTQRGRNRELGPDRESGGGAVREI
jgi:hypothetical protein